MKNEKNKHGMKLLTIWEQDDLHDLAEDIIIGLRYYRYHYDDEGNYIMQNLSEEEHKAVLDKTAKLARTDYLNFRYNEELRQIKFSDAVNMPLDTIKKKYLKDVLRKARGILRKDTSNFGWCAVVSDEIPDSYLDDLLALRWRENLKLWTMQWEQKKENPKWIAERVNDLIANAVVHGGNFEVNTEGLKQAIINLKIALGLYSYRLENVRFKEDDSTLRMFQLVPIDGTGVEMPE